MRKWTWCMRARNLLLFFVRVCWQLSIRFCIDAVGRRSVRARMHINQNKQLSPTLSLSVWGVRFFSSNHRRNGCNWKKLSRYVIECVWAMVFQCVGLLQTLWWFLLERNISKRLHAFCILKTSFTLFNCKQITSIQLSTVSWYLDFLNANIQKRFQNVS